jgi:hypothetical protein
LNLPLRKKQLKPLLVRFHGLAGCRKECGRKEVYMVDYCTTKNRMEQGGDKWAVGDGGALDVEDGGELAIKSGGTLSLESGSILNIENGGALDVSSGSDLDIESGGHLDIESGGVLNILPGGRIVGTAAPADYLTPVIGIGVYGTPVVETGLVDSIAFTVNQSTATDKTDPDSSSMAVYIGAANSVDTPHVKLQGLLASTSVHGDLFDAYAVQGHLTIHDNMATHNPNAHLTGLSGKALLSANVEQGWVSGVLAIVDGAGSVTGLCHAIAAQVEAGVGANVCDAVLFLGADAAVPTAIELMVAANMANLLKINAIAGCVAANALVPAAAPDAGTVGADAALVIDIGGTPYYIPLYDTLHA